MKSRIQHVIGKKLAEDATYGNGVMKHSVNVFDKSPVEHELGE
ncbi:hypothetical protein [Rothia sp. HMSC065D02]|nr:hypothetical protein [Rothia sp. HMSC065D02]